MRGQGVLLLLEGGLGITHCRFLLLEGFALLIEGPGQRSDGRLLALKLSLLDLELGVAAPPKLTRLKCANHHRNGNQS